MTRLAGRMRHRLAEEQGQALVLAVAIIVVGLLLGFGAVAYALSAKQQSVHDERNRSSQQAADAGVQRQLYINSDSPTVGFNLNGGLLGLGTFLDCTVPEFNTGGLQIGTLQVAAGSTGVCPSSCTPTTCTPGPPGPSGWQPLGNEALYESEFLSNQVAVANSGSTAAGNGDDIEFPEIVSIGCHTTNASDPRTACLNGGAGNSYSRQLALLDPTAPLNTVEATNNVTVNSSVSNLNSLLVAQDVTCNKISVLGIGLVTECTVNNSNGLLGAVLGTVQGLVSSLCGTVAILTTGSNQSCVITELVNTVDSTLTFGIVDGNISAGNNLTLPNYTLDAQASTNTLPAGLGNLAGIGQTILTTVTNVVTTVSSGGLKSTFSYGGNVCNESSTQTCGTENTADTTPVTAVMPSFVKTGSVCQAGKPQANCTVARPSFSINSAITAANASNANIPAGATLSSGGSASYIDGDLTLTSGTLTLAPGTYVFCGVYASGGTIANGTSGGVQIYVLATPSTANQCATQPTAGSAGYVQPGSFVACNGLDNTLGDTSLNSLGTASATVNPTALQVYVGGNNSAADGSTLKVGNTDTPVSACPNISVSLANEMISTPVGVGSSTLKTVSYASTKDPATQVYVGALTGSATESTIVYAPASETTINAIATYEGSAIGWNSDITAVALLQDLDLGNYPISSVANAYQVNQTVQCDNSIEALSNTQVGNPTQHSSAGSPVGPASSGGVGDLNGC